MSIDVDRAACQQARGRGKTYTIFVQCRIFPKGSKLHGQLQASEWAQDRRPRPVVATINSFDGDGTSEVSWTPTAEQLKADGKCVCVCVCIILFSLSFLTEEEVGGWVCVYVWALVFLSLSFLCRLYLFIFVCVWVLVRVYVCLSFFSYLVGGGSWRR